MPHYRPQRLGGSKASAPTPPISHPPPKKVHQGSAPPLEFLKTTPTGLLRPGHMISLLLECHLGVVLLCLLNLILLIWFDLVY